MAGCCSRHTGLNWLGRRVFRPVATKKKLWNATKAYGTNDCSEPDPLPSGRSKRQKPKAISE